MQHFFGIIIIITHQSFIIIFLSPALNTFLPLLPLAGRPGAVLHGPPAAAGPGDGADGAKPVAVSHLYQGGGHAEGPAAVHRGHQAKHVSENFSI